MSLEFILEIVVAVLLVMLIGYAYVLNKRLAGLRNDKDELERLARGFVETTERAEQGIGELRSMTEILQERVKRAESLRDDLVFLMERGNAAADRLEGVVRDARDKAGVSPAPAGTGEPAGRPAKAKSDPPPQGRDAQPAAREPLTADPADRPAPDDVSDAERELLKALRSAG